MVNLLHDTQTPFFKNHYDVGLSPRLNIFILFLLF